MTTKNVFLHDGKGNFVGKFAVARLPLGRMPKVIEYDGKLYYPEFSPDGTVYKEADAVSIDDSNRVEPNLREIRKR